MSIKFDTNKNSFRYTCDLCKKEVCFYEKSIIPNFLRLADNNKRPPNAQLVICPVCTEKIKKFAETLRKDDI